MNIVFDEKQGTMIYEVHPRLQVVVNFWSSIITVLKDKTPVDTINILEGFSLDQFNTLLKNSIASAKKL
jgi:hypothetical protein